jgi:cytochrome P450
MTTATDEVYFDLYDWDIRVDPYPVYKRLRDEAPLYRNERHDFYALSRFADVEAMFSDRDTFISGRGISINAVQSGRPQPKGLFIAEDPPLHTRHRAIVSILFTPKQIGSLEPEIRAFCTSVLDDLEGRDEFDFVAELASLVPMQVIGMLLGIPPEDQPVLRERFEASMQRAYDPNADPDTDVTAQTMAMGYDVFGDYLDWRERNPSDDVMTQLLTREFEDETGTMRKLTRQELLTFLILIASGGSDTTSRLMGWIGSVLGDDPDARHELAADPGLVPKAVEEIMRLEPPSYHSARYVARDVEIQGEVVPEGSCLIALLGAAGRDERRFADPDRLDVHREIGRHLSFGYGQHFCLGAALARLESRVLLEEVLQRFPDWEVDHDGARLTPGFITRGWATLPVSVGP